MGIEGDLLTDIAEKPVFEIWLVQRCLLPDDDARHGQAARKRGLLRWCSSWRWKRNLHRFGGE
jgi:hypothetical protein